MINYPKTRRWGLAASAALALLLGCGEDQSAIQPPDPTVTGREYYPMAVDRFWIYDVVDHYWQFNVDSTVRYQVREEVDTIYQGATGEINYRIVRSRRADSTAVWRDDSTSAIVLTSNLVRRTYANVPTLALLFPIQEGRSWNPGIFTPDSSSRRYERVGQPMTLSTGRQFAQTVQVVDEPMISEVERKEQSAAYAWNVGCVYRHRVIFEYCNQNEAGQGICQIGTGFIARGFEREEQLRAWGPR